VLDPLNPVRFDSRLFGVRAAPHTHPYAVRLPIVVIERHDPRPVHLMHRVPTTGNGLPRVLLQSVPEQPIKVVHREQSIGNRSWRAPWCLPVLEHAMLSPETAGEIGRNRPVVDRVFIAINDQWSGWCRWFVVSRYLIHHQ
jgi:hypothetical protein